MKKHSIITMAMILGIVGSTALPTQAAGTYRIKKSALSSNCVIVNGQLCDISDLQGTLKDLCEQVLNGSSNNCQVITLPGCNLPGTGGSGDNGTGSDKPDTEQMPDVNLPGQDNAGNNGNQPEAGNPDVPENSQPGTDNEQPESTPESLSYAEQVVKLVNEERAKAGLSALELDNRIASAALIRAQEIKTSFSHTRPDGRKFSTVLTDNGIRFMGAGENIAWGQTSPEQVMNAWMNSDGHRANILDANFTKIGVGHYQDAAGRHYWAQLFTY